jgi:hypothetical protein
VNRIKSFGLAVAMALALTALLGVSSASANWFVSSSSTTEWNGSRTGNNHVLSLNGESFSCSKVSFSGETLGAVTSQLTVTPELGCTFLGYEANWATNGCKLRFHPGAPVGEQLIGSVDITGCKSPMSMNFSGCLTEIGNQNGVGTVEYKNSTEGGVKVVTIVAKLEGLTFTRSGAICFGAPGTHYNGSYTGSWKVKGFTKGFPVSVAVESAALPSPTIFAAEEAPVTISGTDSVSRKRMGLNGTLGCSTYTLSGTSASVTAKSISLAPAYKNCTFAGAPIPDNYVTAGSCLYVLHPNGSLDIAGAACAEDPIMITSPGCITTVGPQTGLSVVKYSNGGSGKLRTVEVSSSSLYGLKFTAIGPGCWEEGTFSTGSIPQVSLLKATNSAGNPQGLSVE